MSYFIDEGHDFTVFEAPKNGGTTLRLWIYYAGTGELVKSSDSEYYAGTGKTYKQLQEWGYVNGKFRHPPTSEMVCIKRDPIDRFISAFYDKIVKESRLRVTLDDFLNNYDEILNESKLKMNDGKTNFMKFHFESQTYHFGSDPSIYTYVFDIKDIGNLLRGYLESKWSIDLPPLHARNNGGGRRFDMTPSQIDKVQAIYHEDYRNGWH